MLTNRACTQSQFLPASTLANVSSPFRAGGFISNAIRILRQFPVLTPSCSAGILNPIPQIRVCGIGLAVEGRNDPSQTCEGAFTSLNFVPIPHGGDHECQEASQDLRCPSGDSSASGLDPLVPGRALRDRIFQQHPPSHNALGAEIAEWSDS